MEMCKSGKLVWHNLFKSGLKVVFKKKIEIHI